MKNRYLILTAILSVFIMSCTSNKDNMKPYVLEVTTFKYKAGTNVNEFWSEDAKIESTYTSAQPGFISRESGYAQSNDEVVVVVRWKSQGEADASMKKFMEDESVMNYANMIDGPSMKMARYDVK